MDKRHKYSYQVHRTKPNNSNCSLAVATVLQEYTLHSPNIIMYKYMWLHSLQQLLPNCVHMTPVLDSSLYRALVSSCLPHALAIVLTH